MPRKKTATDPQQTELRPISRPSFATLPDPVISGEEPESHTEHKAQQGESAPPPPPKATPPAASPPTSTGVRGASTPGQRAPRLQANDVCFDIETSPLPGEHLTAARPPFDPNDVKMGNLKDPEKIKAKLEEAERDYEQDFINRAALDAKFGYVMMIAWTIGESDVMFEVAEDLEQEVRLLTNFAKLTRDTIVAGGRIISFNGKSFDHTFMMRRMWIQRVTPPLGLITSFKGRQYWSELVTDLFEIWLGPSGYGQGAGQGLDAVSHAVTGLRKIGEGYRFDVQYWQNKKQATDYGCHDVHMTRELARWILPVPAYASSMEHRRSYR